MKVSATDSAVLARIFERYHIYVSRFMENGFNGHSESLRNTNLFIETAEDIAVISKFYPAFAEGKNIADGVAERIENTQLPDPGHVKKNEKSLLLFPESGTSDD